MNCLCCADLREKVKALEASLKDQGFIFVRIGGELKLVLKMHFDCAHKNTDKGKDCYAVACGASGCDDWEYADAACTD